MSRSHTVARLALPYKYIPIAPHFLLAGWQAPDRPTGKAGEAGGLKGGIRFMEQNRGIRFMGQNLPRYDLWSKGPIRFMEQKKTGSMAGPVRSVNFS